MIVHYRDKKYNWGVEYYIKKWCCDEFKEDAEDYDIEVDDNMIQFVACEDEGIRYVPFHYKYCPYCGKEIMIKV